MGKGVHSRMMSHGTRNVLRTFGLISLLLIVFVVFNLYMDSKYPTEAETAEATATLRPVSNESSEPTEGAGNEDWSLKRYPHQGNKILDEPLRCPKPKATPEEVRRLMSFNKRHILRFARHDRWILRYYLVAFGYPEREIPSVKTLEQHLELHKEYFFKLQALIEAAKFKPGKLSGGDYYNDGVTRNRVLTSQPSNYGSKGVAVVVAVLPNGSKVFVKSICGNVQRAAPPKGAKMVKRHGPKPCPKDCNRKLAEQPVQEHKTGPTPGVKRGEPEEVKIGQDQNKGNPNPVPGGKSGRDDGPTTTLPDGSTEGPPSYPVDPDPPPPNADVPDGGLLDIVD